MKQPLDVCCPYIGDNAQVESQNNPLSVILQAPIRMGPKWIQLITPKKQEYPEDFCCFYLDIAYMRVRRLQRVSAGNYLLNLPHHIRIDNGFYTETVAVIVSNCFEIEHFPSSC